MQAVILTDPEISPVFRMMAPHRGDWALGWTEDHNTAMV